VWNSLAKGSASLSSTLLPELCDKFHLSILARSEDLSFHFKFLDVISGAALEQVVTNG